MVKKIKVYAELTCSEEVEIPDWVKTKEDLERFADKYINDNLNIGYELVDEQMEPDDFIEEIESSYQDAKDKNLDSIVIVVDTDLDNSYYINDTDEGFQCDLFDYVFEDLYSVASQLYDELRGNVVEIRIE